ncbi:MAG: hypothetical protein WCL53_01515 [Chloroflexota bacterium]
MAQQSGSGASSGLNENLALALSYIPIVGFVFLLIEPYRSNRTVRFHAIQSLLLFAAAIVVQIAFGIVTGVFYAITPALGALFSGLSNLVSLAFFVLATYLAVKAYQGTSVDAPVVGEFAHRYV